MKLLLALLLCLSFGCISCKRDETPKPKAGAAAMDPDSPEYLSHKADIPLYPDAHLPDNKSNVRSDGEQTRIELVMRTSDAPHKVAAFYVDKLKLERSKEGEAIRLMGKTPKGNYAIIDIKKDGADTSVSGVAIAIGE
jgi:hypothetical protein